MVPNEIPPQYLLSAQAPEPRTLIDILRATVDAYPEVPAIDDGDVVLTYSELWEEVLEGADFLGRSGVQAGDRRVRVPGAHVVPVHQAVGAPWEALGVVRVVVVVQRHHGPSVGLPEPPREAGLAGAAGAGEQQHPGAVPRRRGRRVARGGCGRGNVGHEG